MNFLLNDINKTTALFEINILLCQTFPFPSHSSTFQDSTLISVFVFISLKICFSPWFPWLCSYQMQVYELVVFTLTGFLNYVILFNIHSPDWHIFIYLKTKGQHFSGNRKVTDLNPWFKECEWLIFKNSHPKYWCLMKMRHVSSF